MSRTCDRCRERPAEQHDVTLMKPGVGGHISLCLTCLRALIADSDDHGDGTCWNCGGEAVANYRLYWLSPPTDGDRREHRAALCPDCRREMNRAAITAERREAGR